MADTNSTLLAENLPDYRSFLKTKQARAKPTGFEPDTLPELLFNWQADIDRWAIRQGRAAIFAGCGLGKTFLQLVWAYQVSRYTNRPVLILTPLAVGPQTVEEAAKLGLSATIASKQSEVSNRAGIFITNYQKLLKGHFDPEAFGGVVADECFAKGTLIDVVKDGAACRVPIEKIRVGDKLINVSGIDTVSDVHRRRVPYAVRIRAGEEIIASPNHPVFTQRGWIGAQDLEPGDSIIQTVSAMRMVREGVHAQIPGGRTSEVLRAILLSEMADATTGAFLQGAHTRNTCEDWQESFSLASIWSSECNQTDRTLSQPKTIDSSQGEGEDIPRLEEDEAQTFRAWGEWSWFDPAAEDLSECSWTDLGSGICFVVGKMDSRLSNELQARLGEYRAKNRHRSGWLLSSLQEGTGQEERCKAGFVRVESVEILEPGHPDLEKFRDADGSLYFYDLSGTRHPSFSVNGLLVHNSSILKAYQGKTKQYLLEAFSRTPYRLACTATPAPNDYKELGNHAQFLGVMDSNEMLARWFVPDQSTTGHYVLKGHAAADFWEWVASWAVCLDRPSDLGYPDDGYFLPPIEYHQHVVRVDAVSGAAPDYLYRCDRLTATTMHQEMRLTATARAEKVAELVNGSSEPWVIWCNTDYEQDALESCLAAGSFVSIRGSDKDALKIEREQQWRLGKVPRLVSKPKIFGQGMNWQHCPNAAFVGLSYSYEDFYQAVRRIWRFGQKVPVNVHVVIAETEGEVLGTLKRKDNANTEMRKALVEACRKANFLSSSSRPLRLSEGANPIRLPDWLTCRSGGGI